MKNTILLTKMARSMLIAGLVLGITGAVYAQGIVGGAAAGGAGVGVDSDGIAGQGGSEMPGIGKAVPDLEQILPRREQGVPGVENSSRPRGAGTTAESNTPSRMRIPSLPRY